MKPAFFTPTGVYAGLSDFEMRLDLDSIEGVRAEVLGELCRGHAERSTVPRMF